MQYLINSVLVFMDRPLWLLKDGSLTLVTKKVDRPLWLLKSGSPTLVTKKWIGTITVRKLDKDIVKS